MRIAIILPLSILMSAALFTACRPDAARVTVAEETETTIPLLISPARIDLIFRPDPVRFDRDVMARIQIDASASLAVELPSLKDQLEGLRLEGQFETEEIPSGSDGRNLRTLHLRLIPIAGQRPRLAPMAVVIRDTSDETPRRDEAVTRAVRFDLEIPAMGGEVFTEDLGPMSITDPWRERWRRAWPWAAGALVAAGIAVWLRARHRRPEPPPTAQELARHELQSLLAQDLPAQGRFKDFYSGLTLVVRRYIERLYGIRAPEQTTPEFLDAAGGHPAFPPQTLALLRDFLDAADAVKFAGMPASRETADPAVQTARNYIEADPSSPPESSGTPPRHAESRIPTDATPTGDAASC